MYWFCRVHFTVRLVGLGWKRRSQRIFPSGRSCFPQRHTHEWKFRYLDKSDATISELLRVCPNEGHRCWWRPATRQRYRHGPNQLRKIRPMGEYHAHTFANLPFWGRPIVGAHGKCNESRSSWPRWCTSWCVPLAFWTQKTTSHASHSTYRCRMGRIRSDNSKRGHHTRASIFCELSFGCLFWWNKIELVWRQFHVADSEYLVW